MQTLWKRKDRPILLKISIKISAMFREHRRYFFILLDINIQRNVKYKLHKVKILLMERVIWI